MDEGTKVNSDAKEGGLEAVSHRHEEIVVVWHDCEGRRRKTGFVEIDGRKMDENRQHIYYHRSPSSQKKQRPTNPSSSSSSGEVLLQPLSHSGFVAIEVGGVGADGFERLFDGALSGVSL